MESFECANEGIFCFACANLDVDFADFVDETIEVAELRGVKLFASLLPIEHECYFCRLFFIGEEQRDEILPHDFNWQSHSCEELFLPAESSAESWCVCGFECHANKVLALAAEVEDLLYSVLELGEHEHELECECGFRDFLMEEEEGFIGTCFAR